jgi:hypothetical protein
LMTCKTCDFDSCSNKKLGILHFTFYKRILQVIHRAIQP